MKPVAFGYVRPSTIAETLSILAGEENAKIMAGGQTLGPMLNLRLAQPALVVDISRIAGLAAVSETGESVAIGATVTHAAIEDGRVADPTGGFLARVARGIGYRAVRTRGTIGGSLAHADPAADWLAALTAVGAELISEGPRNRRRTAPLAQFVRGAMETALEADEILTAVSIPKAARGTRFGYHKICRKVGEFAEAIGVAAHDRQRETIRLVASTSHGAPIVIDRPAGELDHIRKGESLGQLLREAGFTGDGYETTLRATALRRALAEAVPA
jgi:aerobic carbon-monoxide dehydrogenase medium subunit